MNATAKSGFRIARTALALGVLTLPVSGCLLAAPSAFQLATYAADGVSYAATGKSVTDHLVSEVTAKDCAMKRVLDGEDICKEKEIARYPDGTPVPRADDVAAGVVPAGQDQEFQNFAVTASDASGADDAESLDAPAQRFDGFAQNQSEPQSDPQSETQSEPLPVQQPANAVAPQDGQETLRVAANEIAAEVRATPAPSVPVYAEGQPMPELDTPAQTPAPLEVAADPTPQTPDAQQNAPVGEAEAAAEQESLAADGEDVPAQNADPFDDEDEGLDVQSIQQIEQTMGR